MLNYIINMDIQVIKFVDKYFHNPVIDFIMVVFTWLGEVGAIWICILLVLLFFKKYRETAIITGIAMICTAIIVELILKITIQRPRPYEVLTYIKILIPAPWSHSFPSGHSSSSFSAAVLLVISLKKHWLSLLAVCLALLIPFTRLYLKVHFPSDILAGALIGTTCALLVWYIYHKIRVKKKDSTSIQPAKHI